MIDNHKEKTSRPGQWILSDLCAGYDEADGHMRKKRKNDDTSDMNTPVAADGSVACSTSAPCMSDKENVPLEAFVIEGE
jgi:hypothetical protein